MVASTAFNADVLIAAMSGICAFVSCIVVSWPYLAPNKLSVRMQEMAAEYEATRVRERRNGDDKQRRSLRSEPRQIFKEIFDRLNLAQQLNDSSMVRNLR